MNRNTIYAVIVSAALVAAIVTLWHRHKSDPVIDPHTPAGPAGVAHNEGTGGFKPFQPNSDLVSHVETSPEKLEAARQRRHQQFLALLEQKDKRTSPPPVDPSTLPPDSEQPPPTTSSALAQVTPSPAPRDSTVPDQMPYTLTRPRQTQIAEIFDHDTPTRPANRRRTSDTDFEAVSWHEPANAEWLISERRSLKSADVRSRRISVVTGGDAVNIVVPGVAFGTTAFEVATMRPPTSTMIKLQQIGASAVSMRAHVTIAAISSGSHHEMPATVGFVANELVGRGVLRSDISIHILNLGSPVSSTDALDRRSVSIALETTDVAFHSQTIHDLAEMLLHPDSTMTH